MFAYAGTVAGDYWILDGSSQDFFIIGLVANIFLGIVGLVLLFFARRYRRLMHDFMMAQVRINLNPIRIGNTLHVQLRQSLLRPLDIEEACIGLVCIEDLRQESSNKRHVRYTSDEAWSVWKQIIANRAFGLGEEIVGEAALAIPSDADTSGCADKSGYPYYHWFVALCVKARGEPQFWAHFPIRVES